jgi:hypothetical protein
MTDFPIHTAIPMISGGRGKLLAIYMVLIRTLGLIGQEAINFRNSTVVGHDGKAMISRIQNEVLTHDGQTDEAEITTRDRLRRSADIDAGETGAEVSQIILSTRKLCRPQKHKSQTS